MTRTVLALLQDHSLVLLLKREKSLEVYIARLVALHAMTMLQELTTQQNTMGRLSFLNMRVLGSFGVYLKGDQTMDG